VQIASPGLGLPCSKTATGVFEKESRQINGEFAMQRNKLSLIVGLVSVLTSTWTLALAENSLFADAQAVLPLHSGDSYFWKDQRTLLATTNGGEYQIDRRTHRRTLIQRIDTRAITIDQVVEIPAARPKWLPPGAKIVGFDSGFRSRHAHREAWVVVWPVRESATQPETSRSGRAYVVEARYGVWITGPNGTMPHLLGIAPLSRPEFAALTRGYDFLFLPDGKEVSFVYRGVLYVMPIFGKPATI
jgi:hypothetical protein